MVLRFRSIDLFFDVVLKSVCRRAGDVSWGTMKIANDSEATPVCVCVKLRAPVPLADQFGTTPDNTLESTGQSSG